MEKKEKSSFNSAKLVDFIKKYAMVMVLAGVLVFFAFATKGKILLPSNISNIISQNAYVFILTTGMLLCILTGGNIDLSVGSVVCFVGAVGATLITLPSLQFEGIMGQIALVLIVIIAMVVTGVCIGVSQAFIIAYIRIPPFIVTLAGMLIFRGLSNIVLKGLTVSIADYPIFVNIFGGGANCYIPDLFKGLGLGINLTCILVGLIAVAIYIATQVISRMKRVKKGYEVEKFVPYIVKMVLITAVIIAVTVQLARYKGIPTVLVIVMLVIIVYSYITQNTTTGRYFYAVGGNEKATKLSGINTNKTFFLAYMNMGFLAAVAGMVTIARMTSAQPTYGQNYEMDAIASCFIGGASAYGGVGTVPAAIIGAVLMGVINLGMLTMGVDQNMQKVVKGIVLLLAVIFDVVSKRGFKLIAKN